MKAAVVYQKGGLPEYTEVSAPLAGNEDEILVSVKAVAIKHFDKGRAAGSHYSAHEAGTRGQIPGSDGVCLLDDGSRVYGIGVGGMLAERAVIEKDYIVKVPAGLSDEVAAALPNGVMGAAMGLKFKAKMQPGDVVLVNGATGFTGRIAVQIAKYYGAKKIIATGRNQQSLQELLSLGADEIININEGFEERLKAIHTQTTIDVIIDYLWGHTAEQILSILKGKGNFTNKIRYVSVGSMAGDLMQFSAAWLRSVDIQLTGSGLGAWTRQEVKQLITEILPEMFQLAAEGKLVIDTASVSLEDIASLWSMEVNGGQRLVVTI